MTDSTDSLESFDPELGGCSVRPTVIVDVNNETTIVREEVSGNTPFGGVKQSGEPEFVRSNFVNGIEHIEVRIR